MKRTLALLATLGLGAAGVCQAGVQTGVVTKIEIRSSDGLVYFYLSGNATGKPTCAKYPYWMIQDENSNAGKQQLAALFMAQATGKAVTVWGRDSCTRWLDGEDVNQIELSAN